MIVKGVGGGISLFWELLTPTSLNFRTVLGSVSWHVTYLGHHGMIMPFR